METRPECDEARYGHRSASDRRTISETDGKVYRDINSG